MQKTILNIFLSCLTAASMLIADEQPRILNLIPGLLVPLAVEPAIPENFIAMAPNGIPDPYDWIYWGQKEALEAYFRDPSSLKESILSVTLSGNVKQSGPHDFGPHAKQALEMMKAMDPKGFASTETTWGAYPVLAVKTQIAGHTMMMAWVGLNSPDGWTLLFNLVYPDQKEHPDQQGIALWQHFLMNTKPLADGDFFKAYGQDMQEGSTSVQFGGAKYHIMAEKRLSDGMIQIVYTPDMANLEFQYRDMCEGLMGAQWKYGTPIVKVYATLITTEQNSTNTIDYVTTIFLKPVSEFSVNKAEAEKSNGVLIYQKA